MDNLIDVEAVRATLKAMPRPEALQLAEKAGVAIPTAEKFRNGHIKELGGSKLAALLNALNEREAAVISVPPQGEA